MESLKNSIDLVDKGVLQTIIQSPLLRVSRVLEGLFCEKVIVTEAEADELVYQELIEKVFPQSGLYFAHGQNKQTLVEIAEMYKAVGIRYEVITDFDILRVNDEFNKFIKKMSIDESERQRYRGYIGKLRDKIDEEINADGMDADEKKKALKANRDQVYHQEGIRHLNEGELKENIEKYWGKYSFLSLLVFEEKEKNKEYVKNNISQKILEIINKILSMTIHVNKWYLNFMPDNYMKQNVLADLKSGVISKNKIDEIKKYENVLNIFFTQAYADIKSVKYVIEEKDDKIRYKLFFNKMIGGTLKSIPIELESEGTKKIIEEFDTLIGAIMGETVVIDEIDNGIHDLLMKNIILSIKDEITGQLIITTHNTLLLEILPKECIYILSADYEGNKYINSIKEYGITIQKNHNARDLYFKGLFGGIPTTSYVDFEEIKYVLEDSEEKEEKNNGEET